MTNIDTHTNKQTNTQGENIITSLSRVIIKTFCCEKKTVFIFIKHIHMGDILRSSSVSSKKGHYSTTSKMFYIALITVGTAKLTRPWLIKDE